MSKTYKLKEIAKHLNAHLVGDGECEINNIASLEKAKTGEITFLTSKHYEQYLASTQASAVILKEEFAKQCPGNCLIMKDPYLGFAKTAQLFDDTPRPAQGIHPTVVMGKDCIIGENVSIGPYCAIGDYVSIGKNTIIGSNTSIGPETKIGENNLIYTNVSIYHRIVIGNHCIIQSNAVIGSDGFGITKDEYNNWIKIPQQGRVIIGNKVEIGANTTIDRGALEDTIIEEGVKIDNQVQIAHNVHIGAHTAIAGCVGIAGSVTIGKHCILAGSAGISGHVTLTDDVIIAAMTGVSKSITEPGIYSAGFPAQPHLTWGKQLARFKRLENLIKRVKNLEKKNDDIEY